MARRSELLLNRWVKEVGTWQLHRTTNPKAKSGGIVGDTADGVRARRVAILDREKLALGAVAIRTARHSDDRIYRKISR